MNTSIHSISKLFKVLVRVFIGVSPLQRQGHGGAVAPAGERAGEPTSSWFFATTCPFASIRLRYVRRGCHPAAGAPNASRTALRITVAACPLTIGSRRNTSNAARSLAAALRRAACPSRRATILRSPSGQPPRFHTKRAP